MLTARETSNAFLVDQVQASERMRALAETPHPYVQDAELEAVIQLVVCGLALTTVLLLAVWL